MALHIESCIEFFRGLIYPDGDFAEDYVASLEAGKLEPRLEIYEEYVHLEYVFIIAMSEALLSGEYLTDGYRKRLAELSNLFLHPDYEDYGEGPFVPFVSYLYDIERLIREIERWRSAELDVLFLDGARVAERDPFSVKVYQWLCVYALRLTEIDHQLVVDLTVLRELVVMRHFFADLHSKARGDLRTVSAKFKSKASFLIRKMYYHDGLPVRSVVISGKKVGLETLVEPDDYNRDFCSIFDDIYHKGSGLDRKLSNEWLAARGGSILACVSKACFLSTASTERVDLEALANVEEEFEDAVKRLANDAVQEFDRVAISSARAFIRNCRLSMELRRQTYTTVQLQGVFKRIKSEQLEDKISNYHPYQKILEHVTRRYVDEREQLIPQHLVELYEEVLVSYRLSQNWWGKSKRYPVQLPMADCITSRGVFIASSIARPIDLAAFEREDQRLRDTPAYLRVQSQIGESENKLHELSDRFSKEKRESYEVLGLFMAIVAFLFSGVKLLGAGDERNVYMKVISMGLVLVLFMAMLYAVLSVPRRHKWWVFLLVAAVAVGLAFALPSIAGYLGLGSAPCSLS